MKGLFCIALLLAAVPLAAQDLWRIARSRASIHRFSSLFTARNVRDSLSSDSGIAEAIDWCRRTGITKVYLETYRSRYRADRATLARARDRFRRAGFQVSGAVTTTQIGKISTGWNLISCYTNPTTQAQLRSIFEYSAGLFNEIMIDDFWFTDCTCEECDTARKARQVRIGDKRFRVPSTSWEDYRAELMVQLSRIEVIGAAKRVNPNVKLIVKYPQWYDRYHERGYDVIRQTRDFDGIWAGTESRDRDKNGQMQYESYFVLRWLSSIGGRKTGGGWFDPLETTEATYIEQARQTILAGAKETVLFSYGALHQNFGPTDIAALRAEIPELLDVAAEVQRRSAIGIAAYKPPHSSPEDEPYVYDYVGMLGLPLLPVREFPAHAKAAFLPIHAAKDPDLETKLKTFAASGRPLLLTDGLARRLSGKIPLDAENVWVLKVGGRPAALSELAPQQLNALREPLLEPFGIRFRAPSDVGLYLFADGSWVVENFADRRVQVNLNGEDLLVGPRAWVFQWK